MPTQIDAQAAVERIVAPDRDPQFRYDTIPWEGATASPAATRVAATSEISGDFNLRGLQLLFAPRTVEPETKIVGEHYTTIDGIPVLCERWNWDRVTASSAIVPKKYVATLEEPEILSLLRKQIAIADDYTFSDHADSQFIFVNYDFLLLD